MNRIKIATDVEKKELEFIDEACILEQRSRANFLKLACIEKANKILGKNKNATTN